MQRLSRVAVHSGTSDKVSTGVPLLACLSASSSSVPRKGQSGSGQAIFQPHLDVPQLPSGRRGLGLGPPPGLGVQDGVVTHSWCLSSP